MDVFFSKEDGKSFEAIERLNYALNDDCTRIMASISFATSIPHSSVSVIGRLSILFPLSFWIQKLIHNHIKRNCRFGVTKSQDIVAIVTLGDSLVVTLIY